MIFFRSAVSIRGMMSTVFKPLISLRVLDFIKCGGGGGKRKLSVLKTTKMGSRKSITSVFIQTTDTLSARWIDCNYNGSSHVPSYMYSDPSDHEWIEGKLLDRVQANEKRAKSIPHVPIEPIYFQLFALAHGNIILVGKLIGLGFR